MRRAGCAARDGARRNVRPDGTKKKRCMQHVDYRDVHTLHDPITVKVVIFKILFARRNFFFLQFLFLQKSEAAGKKCEMGRLADYIPGETLPSFLVTDPN